MKTFYQFNESIAGALKKFGSEGLRKAAVKYAPKFKSTVKKLSTLKFEKKLLKKTVKGSSQTQSTAKNLLAKSQVSNPKNSGFNATVKPLGSSTGSRVSTGTKDLQFQGNLKGGEYKRKISGAGDKSPMGAITGSRGKGNKALRRSGQADKITDYEKTGRKPTPMFRKTKAELTTVTKDPSTLKQEPHKWNPGDLYMQSVDIKQSKEKSRSVREFIRQNQKRMANIKKGKGPLGMSEDKTSKPVYGDGHDYTKGVALTGRLDFGKGKKSEYDVGLSYKGSVLARKTRKFDKPEKTSPKDAVDAALNKLNKKTPDKGGERTT
jgi:hypothetical protein